MPKRSTMVEWSLNEAKAFIRVRRMKGDHREYSHKLADPEKYMYPHRYIYLEGKLVAHVWIRLTENNFEVFTQLEPGVDLDAQSVPGQTGT